jgi:hypothetical protein
MSAVVACSTSSGVYSERCIALDHPAAQPECMCLCLFLCHLHMPSLPSPCPAGRCRVESGSVPESDIRRARSFLFGGRLWLPHSPHVHIGDRSAAESSAEVLLLAFHVVPSCEKKLCKSVDSLRAAPLQDWFVWQHASLMLHLGELPPREVIQYYNNNITSPAPASLLTTFRTLPGDVSL